MEKKYICIEKRLEGYTLTLTVVYLGVQTARDHFPSGLYVFIYDIHREHASISFIIRRKKDSCKSAHCQFFWLALFLFPKLAFEGFSLRFINHSYKTRKDGLHILIFIPEKQIVSG